MVYLFHYDSFLILLCFFYARNNQRDFWVIADLKRNNWFSKQLKKKNIEKSERKTWMIVIFVNVATDVIIR